MDSGPHGSLSFCASSDSKATEKISGSGGGRELRLGVREGQGEPGLPRTYLPAVHVQQDHVPHIVSCDHHSAFGRHVQAAKPEAGGTDYGKILGDRGKVHLFTVVAPVPNA